MNETIDALEVFWSRGQASELGAKRSSRAPSVGRVAGIPSEAAVVVSDEASQDAVGRIQIGGLGQADFAAEAILKPSPKAEALPKGVRSGLRPAGSGAAIKRMASCWSARPN